MKRIIAFAGSNSKKSMNKKLAAYAASLVEDVEVKILDLNDFDVPLFGVDLEAEMGHPENAKRLFEEIKNTDGIILSLAEHNGAYSAVFKNLFDWMSRIDTKTFKKKPMLLMAASPGGRGGASVLAIAKDRFRFHEGNIVASFSLPFFADNFSDGKIVNEELNAKLLEEVKRFKENVFALQIQHTETDKEGKFYIEVDGVQVAEMTYKYIGDKKIDIDHTEVDPSLKGQGVGYKLVEKAVAFMQEKGIKAAPSCSYAAAVFNKKEEYAERLA
ncbi:GNAT family N-acetyltransferase [Oceanihabitans sediminis]|uniref:GNAT family N-acetyltransferase n=1 Tax=Oceanihabitans sediminis TaxID=1812012 RepID=A0A368P8Q5_9FLAO|nr:GNAT family N-acetyltransferase [Oceanihabitans sediminis]MDX1277911.1 GNAT family N-acetyltransferase [Oceanihabitans sediminis]MDX1773405.1 GNAT family N-acetyltransferase [Oceanihabitans sediminis]RBP32861.1 NAD(P)H-dependent FMN reductase [Oceanihabitans sediminis]RCU57611.1 GNAT family N-acetyltransferase [Oceanihabitans sediminis]